MKHINVVAAIIIKDSRVFSTKRGYGDFKDGWEFPGGKIEEGESKESALIREIKEELDTDIKVEKFLNTIEYDYPSFHISMSCFICSILNGNLTLLEHKDAKWLTAEQLDTVGWLPADMEILPLVKKVLEEIAKD